MVWLAASDCTGATSLFLDTAPLEMELQFDRGGLCRGGDDSTCEPLPATLLLMEAGGEQRSIRVELEARGAWRLHEMRCRYPPLFVRFDAGQTAGSVFEGQSVLPLTTHCFSNRPEFRNYVLKEYLAYRIYNQLTDASVRARLARVTYRDETGRAERRIQPAFFTEHFRSVATRRDSALFTSGRVIVGHLDDVEMTRLALFQHLIWNTDWSVIGLHNTVLLQHRDGGLTPLPFDFDFSGLVNASYAAPPPKVGIKRVTQRVFRGFCHAGLDWDSLYVEFADAREAIFGTTGEIAIESPRAARQAEDFLRGFYRTLESGKKRDRKIRQSCRPLPAGQVIAAPGADAAGMR